MTNPMRATIIPADTFCSVDGVGYNGVDMTSVGPEVHAVQWYGTWGEEEYIDLETRRMETNVRITSLDAYAAVFTAFQQIVEAEHRAEEEASVERTITEV
jgi:hypothetical protein